jgi:hypothetical protein
VLPGLEPVRERVLALEPVRVLVLERVRARAQVPVPVPHRLPPVHPPGPLPEPELKSFFYSFSSPFKILALS